MPVLKRWSWLAPLAALAVFATGSAGLLSVHSPLYLLLAPPVLIAAVFAAVRHAETVSIRGSARRRAPWFWRSRSPRSEG